MRILYISYVKFGGGNWVHTTQFLNAFKKLHNDVVVYMPEIEGEQSQSERKIIKFKNSYGPFRELRFIIAAFLRKMYPEFRQLKKMKPDFVILRRDRYLSVIILCRLFNIPLLLEVNESAQEKELLPKKYRMRWIAFWQWFEKVMLNLSTHIIVVSEPLRQYFISRNIPANKITTVPNGVNSSIFNPRIDGIKVKKILGLKNKIVIGFSGAFSPWHGLDFLAKSIKTYLRQTSYKDEIILLLIGKEGPVFEKPANLSNEYTITTGYIPHNEMPGYLAVIDIFVAPYPRIEPFHYSPLKIYEAMAMGIPVVASAQGQICDIITDGFNGVLYIPEDEKQFIGKLDMLINDGKLRKKLGKQARATIEKKYTWENNARRILNLCKQYMKE